LLIFHHFHVLPSCNHSNRICQGENPSENPLFFTEKSGKTSANLRIFHGQLGSCEVRTASAMCFWHW
jgi:hypothetical protein